MIGLKIYKDFFFLIGGNLARYEGENVLFPTAPKEKQIQFWSQNCPCKCYFEQRGLIRQVFQRLLPCLVKVTFNFWKSEYGIANLLNNV